MSTESPGNSRHDLIGDCPHGGFGFGKKIPE
jgi:hypothetical protein